MEPLPPSPFTCADAYRGKASRDSDSWSLALTQKLLSPGCASLEFQARHRSLRASGVPWRWDCPPSRSDPTSSAWTWSCRRPPARCSDATRFSRRPHGASRDSVWFIRRDKAEIRYSLGRPQRVGSFVAVWQCSKIHTWWTSGSAYSETMAAPHPRRRKVSLAS